MGVPAGPGVSASGESPYGTTDLANGVVQGTFTAIGPGKPFALYGPMDLSIWCEYVTTLTTTAASLTATTAAAGPIAVGQAIRGANVPKGTTIGTYADPSATLLLPTYTYWGKVINGIARITDLMSTTGLVGAAVSGYGIPASTTVSAILTPAVAPNLFSPGVKGVVSLNNAVNLAPPNDEGLPYEFALGAAAVATGADAAAAFTGSAVGITGTVQLERSFDGGSTWLPCNIGSSGAIAIWNTTSPVSLSFGEPEKGVLYRLNNISQTPVAGIALKYRISATGQAATTLAVPTI